MIQAGSLWLNAAPTNNVVPTPETSIGVSIDTNEELVVANAALAAEVAVALAA